MIPGVNIISEKASVASVNEVGGPGGGGEYSEPIRRKLGGGASPQKF